MKLRKMLLLGFSAAMILSVVSAGAIAKEVKDIEISNHIVSEFWGSQQVPANTVNVETSDGVVTLTGVANDILAKDRAREIAEATVGVRAVINRIDVAPKGKKSDGKLRRDIEQALLDDPATESFEVDVEVDAGEVTLTGTVDSWQEKQLVTVVVKDVKGVVDVKNNIDVDYETERSDYEIQQEVEKRLKHDVRVDDALIDVEVKDQQVHLSGAVGSLQEKNQAQSDGWVAGVESVKAEDLEIEWWAREEMRREDLYKSLSDEEIADAVKDAFLYDPRLYSFNVDVDVNYGVVTLSGIVENLPAKNAAEQDARNTMGVTRVINNIQVQPEVLPTNKKIEQEAAEALLNDIYIDRYDIDVDVTAGTIYLSGNVNTSWEKNRAEQVVEGVEGAVYVVNNIEAEHQWQWKPDWEILEDVRSELEWSPFVDSDEVDITVSDGIVTLSGTVDTYSEKQSAADNAYEGGAKDVRNQLSVNYTYYGPYYSYSPYSPGYYGAPYMGYYYPGYYYPGAL